ncbi:hypothetical protein DICA1_E17722 [Diutina catenulata]
MADLMYARGELNDGMRRCRRCKRKRLDDEPAEVQQYKTCAKCRIIERNKKNSRKPLAEETMLYGMKQFQEQSVSGNFMEEEIFFKDEFFRRFQNKPFNYEAEMHEMMSNPNYSSQFHARSPPESSPRPQTSQYNFKSVPIQGLSGGSPTQQYTMMSPQQSAAAVAAAAQAQQLQSPPPMVPAMPPAPQAQFQGNPQAPTAYGNRQTLAMPTTGTVPPSQGATEDALAELAKIGDTTAAELANADFDPYALDNVYDDYQDYLVAVLQARQAGHSAKNMVYLKEFDEEFTFNLSRFDSTAAKGAGTNDPYKFKMGGDKHARTVLLNNLKTLYVDPVVAVLNVEVAQTSANLADYKASSSLVAVYNFIYDDTMAFVDQQQQSKINQASVYVNYNRAHNLLILKTNYLLFEPSGHRYTAAAKAKVNTIYKKLEYEKTLNPAVVEGPVGHNLPTAQAVYDRLVLEADPLGEEMRSLDPGDFYGDFINFESVFPVEEGYAEEEGEEMDEDDDEDGVADAALVEDMAAVAAELGEDLDGKDGYVDGVFE